MKYDPFIRSGLAANFTDDQIDWLWDTIGEEDTFWRRVKRWFFHRLAALLGLWLAWIVMVLVWKLI